MSFLVFSQQEIAIGYIFDAQTKAPIQTKNCD